MLDNTPSTPTTTDAVLLERMTQGDERALGDLYDRYGRLVYSIALHVVRDRSVAEEVTQDVFQSVWQNCSRYQSDRGTFAGWLIGITRHRAIDETRSRSFRARNAEQDVDDALLALPAKDGDFDEQVVNHDLVFAALGTLPDAQRQAVQLTYFGGLNSREIGEMLQISTGTVKTRIRLAFQKLTLLLQPE